ncbi:hypothetical protein JCM21900_001694 [Sporobolomyces salmonicolor]
MLLRKHLAAQPSFAPSRAAARERRLPASACPSRSSPPMRELCLFVAAPTPSPPAFPTRPGSSNPKQRRRKQRRRKHRELKARRVNPLAMTVVEAYRRGATQEESEEEESDEVELENEGRGAVKVPSKRTAEEPQRACLRPEKRLKVAQTSAEEDEE